MDPSTINPSTFIVYNMVNGTELGRTVFSESDTKIAKIKLDSNLEYLTDYKVTVSPKVGDLAGNSMVNEYSWTFTTEKEPDVIPPKVVSTVPADKASVIPVRSLVTATFSEEMDPSTISVDTFTVAERDSAHRISGRVFRSPDDSKVWKFKPGSNLKEYTTYIANISREVSDVSGNKMDSDYSWSFTTEQITPP